MTARPFTLSPVYALLCALALAVAVALGGLRAWRFPQPSALRSGDEPARIEVRRPREDLILTREAGGPWLVARQDDLADSESVQLLLGGLRALEFGPPIGRDDAAAASGLGPADSVSVRVLDAGGRTLFEGLFGRRVFGRSAYFRGREKDAVRLASGLDSELLRRPAAQWREPRLLPGGCAQGLEISRGRAWRRVSDDAARDLCALRASHWATGTPEGLAGFDKPLLAARTLDGRGFTVGERRGEERLVRVDGREALLRIPAAPIEAAAADLIGSKP